MKIIIDWKVAIFCLVGITWRTEYLLFDFERKKHSTEQVTPKSISQYGHLNWMLWLSANQDKLYNENIFITFQYIEKITALFN